jgi:hypothetical protein
MNKTISTEQIKEKAIKTIQNINPDQEEGNITKKLENQTSKIPSSFFLTAAIGSIAASAALKINGREKDAQFVGQWVAPFLLLGVYNKIVKTLGND